MGDISSYFLAMTASVWRTVIRVLRLATRRRTFAVVLASGFGRWFCTVDSFEVRFFGGIEIAVSLMLRVWYVH